VWPYWDPDCGTWLGDVDDEGASIATGEIKMWKLHQGEVLWEAGLPFTESKWVCIRKAQPISKIMSMPDYIGPAQLKQDAKAGMWERPGASRAELAFVYHYLKKPGRDDPEGKWYTYVGNELVKPSEPYPRLDGGDCVHELPWIPMPHKHRHLGAGEQLVDVQRSWSRTINQIIAWKNLVLVPQIMAPVGSLQVDPSDEEGAVLEYRPIAGQVPQWREVPPIPESLFRMLDLCIQDFDHILNFQELPPGIESGSGVQSMDQRRNTAKAMFINGLARWYASVGQHLLQLIAKHYTEPRLLEVDGRMGVDRYPDFIGGMLGSPGSLSRPRVRPSSIEPRTKAAMEARLMGYAERGWIHPHQAMAAINGGVAAQLVDRFELDIARQHREIDQLIELGKWAPSPAQQRSIEMYGLVGGQGLPPDVQQGLPQVPYAEDYDEHQVHIDVLEQWMKTREFEQQPEAVKAAAKNHRAQHEWIEDQEAMKEQTRMMSRAAGLGMGNAARDVGVKASPSPASQGTLQGAAQQPRGE
jgi:hypothetical protein